MADDLQKLRTQFLETLKALDQFENGLIKEYCYLVSIFNMYLEARNDGWFHVGNIGRCAIIAFQIIGIDYSEGEKELLEIASLAAHRYISACSTKDKVNVEPLQGVIAGLRGEILGKDKKAISALEKIETEALGLRGRKYRENYWLLETIGKFAHEAN